MPEYDFHTLSPMDFELLVRDLLQAHLQIELQAFAHGPDGGVDLRSSDNEKTTVVQCKHYRGSSFSDLKTAAKKEKTKMDPVSPDDYYFVTSQDLSLTQQEALIDELSPHITDTNQIFAMRDLNQLLGLFPAVEQNHFKLWMASAGVIRQIVQSGIWQRSEALMEDIQDRVRLYVVTPSFAKARRMLAENKVCVITGAPGVGKSMLADMLALSQWQTGWKIIELESHEISKAWEAWDGGTKQFFYFDDVFGQTDIQERLSNDNGITVARLIRRVGASADKQMVITTRTHVLQEAELRDEPLSRAGLHARECIVEVTDYTEIHRARILYNHLYFSDLPRDLIRQFVNEGLHRQVMDHRNFTPRLIEQTIIQQGAEGTAAELLERMIHALDHPIQLWGPSFREALTEPARKILMHLVAFPPHGAPLNLLQAASVRGATPIEYQKALIQLEGSWINIVAEPGDGAVVSFHNPSCRDFVLTFLDSQSEYVLDVLQNSTSTVQLAQLIRYADAAGRGSDLKYPAIQAVIRHNSAEIAELIRRVWEAESSTTSNHAARTLNSFRVANEEYEWGLGDWIIEQAMTLSGRINSNADASGGAAWDLAAVIRDSGYTPSTSEEISSCKCLFWGCFESVGEFTEWDQVFAFGEWLERVGGVTWTPDEESRMHTSFEAWLDGEFQAILDNADKAEDARDWVGDLHGAAVKYFGSGSFDDRFTDFDKEVAHKFGEDFEPTADDWADMWAGEAIEASETSVTSVSLDSLKSKASLKSTPWMSEEEAQIRALFDQLE